MTFDLRDGEPVRMIAGMSRAGTVWLCRSLNAHSLVASFGESNFFGRCFVSPGRDGYYSEAQLRRVVDGLKRRRLGTTIGDGQGCLAMNHARQVAIISEEFEGETGKLGPGDVFRRMCQAIAKGNGKTISIEKTPQHLLCISRILRYLPHVRMVVMLRDPYSFMLSYKNQGVRKPQHTRESFASLYHPLVCALIWRSYLRAAFYEAERCPQQLLLVRNEELKRPEELLQRVQRFLQIEPVERLRGAVAGINSSFPDGSRPELDSADLYWMNRLARREIEQYGCEYRPLPRQARIAGARSLAKLPIWSIRSAIKMQRLVNGNPFAYLAAWLKPARTHSR